MLTLHPVLIDFISFICNSSYQSDASPSLFITAILLYPKLGSISISAILSVWFVWVITHNNTKSRTKVVLKREADKDYAEYVSVIPAWNTKWYRNFNWQPRD